MNQKIATDAFFAEHPVSASTRETYTYALRRFSECVANPETCTPVEILKMFKTMGWGSSLQYTASVAIKKYLRWRYGAAHPALLLKIKREKSKPGRHLTVDQATELLDKFDLSKLKGKRDYATACLALDTGLRVAELSSLKMADVDFAARTLKVRVKGGSWADAVFSDHTRAALVDWCNHRRLGDDRLFQVSRDGLRVIVRRWGEKLGIRLSPHDLRRSFAHISSKSGAPSRLVQVAGRWSSIEMVERYTQGIEPADFENYFPVSRIVD